MKVSYETIIVLLLNYIDTNIDIGVLEDFILQEMGVEVKYKNGEFDIEEEDLKRLIDSFDEEFLAEHIRDGLNEIRKLKEQE